jgi:peptidoglycan/LPS O-acetylase OafA/YrhL
VESLLWAKFFAFAAGMVLAWSLSSPSFVSWWQQKRGGGVLAGLGIALFVAMPLLWGSNPPPAYETRGWSAFGLTCFSALSGVCLLAAALAETPLKRMLGLPVAVFFGKVSYCFYLVHMLILCLCKGAIVSGLAQASGMGEHSKLVLVAGLMISFALSVGAAWVLHAVIEEPCRRWLLNRRRWECLRWTAKPAPSAP